MLVIRMQRTGRKGHAMFRVVVQDSRRTPTSGKIVAQLGSYDPHTKNLTLNKERAEFYLEHGTQPSDRVARLLKAEGVKLPTWVKLEADKARDIRNADKRRSTRPPEAEVTVDEPAAPAETEAPAAEASETAADAGPEAVATVEESEVPAAEAPTPEADKPQTEDKPDEVPAESPEAPATETGDTAEKDDKKSA